MASSVLRRAQTRPATAPPDRPRADHSSARRTSDLRQQVEGLVLRRVQGQRRCVHPHGGATAGPLHMELSRIIHSEKPDLVLLDLVLRLADGIALLGGVPELAKLRVVFISGYGRDETIA